MRLLAAAFPAILLVACGDASTPAPEPARTAPPAAGPRTLIPADFADIALGQRFEGVQGDEVSSELVDATGKTIGTLVSYVACPAEVEGDSCDPAELPPESAFTYVHVLTLDAGFEPEEPGALGVFQTSRRATGFNNIVGYDAEQVLSSLGEEGDIKVQIDSGKLIWRISAGDGLDAGESLTFFWQSTLPPQGAAEAYRWDIGGVEIDLSGPFPGSEEAARDAGKVAPSP